MKPLHMVLIVCAGLGASPVRAMTLHEVEMTCPYDGTKFTFQAQGSGTTFDKSLDFMAIGPIRSPWPIAICPTNGFVFIKDEYSPEDLERLRPLVLSPDYQALKGETPYYHAAWITERDGGAHRKVSIFLMQATWEAGQNEVHERYQARSERPGAPEPDYKDLLAEGTQSERYKRYATELLARLPDDIAADPGDASETFRLLKGELLRRLGRFDEADAYFKELASRYASRANISKYIAFQRQLIAKRDIGIHRISQANAQK